MAETLTTTSIPDGAWREVALSDDEYAQIVELLGREPTPVELGMFGAMWSEHCGYKHSRPLLKQLPTSAPWVLQGPGENAGAVDIGDGLAVVFKVESHNHPSAVEPYQGAATGVGGIVRDIFTMGARPIAILNGLRFGPPGSERNDYLFTNVVAGIGGYGNCLGIPTVGGDLFFDESFDGNPLVNAMCAGIVPHEGIVRAKASGPGNVIMLIGADTGRDGLHGATFASVDDPESTHRGVIQVGNPFLEKLLLEASLELLASGDVIAMQDLGAAGLTSSIVECASRGGVGAEIEVACVPRREEGLSAYEVMLSESQERMVLVVAPENVDRVNEIVHRWSLHSAAIGTITDDGQVRVLDHGEPVVDVDAQIFTESCPTYVREAVEDPATIERRSFDPLQLADLNQISFIPALKMLLESPNIQSREPVYRRYDYTILTNTVVGPGDGDSAVLRIKGTSRGIALSLDCNSRYCSLDPRLGAQHAVASATRNVVCGGGKPLALTNCLNFGNPERSHGYFELQQAVRGMGEAAAALNTPVVSGNVSLYNETAGSRILPTPMVGAVGVLEDVRQHATLKWKHGDAIVLIFDQTPTLGGSEYLYQLTGGNIGQPPGIDLEYEARLQDGVRRTIANGMVKSAHDTSLGGLAVALARMAICSGTGFALNGAVPSGAHGRVDERWYGEAASRVLLGVAPSELTDVTNELALSGLRFLVIGHVGGDSLDFGPIGSVPLAQATSWFYPAMHPEKEVITS